MVKEIKKTTLHCTEGNSDKLYVIWIEGSVSEGYQVYAQWGRRGNSMQNGMKTNGPVTLEKAEAVLDKVVKSKCVKGYRAYGAATTSYTHVASPMSTGVRPMLLTPASENDLEWLIKSDDWAVQQKMNGTRLCIQVTADGTVIGTNRSGGECSVPVPVVNALQSFNHVITLDGELVNGVFHVFDILCFNGKDLTDDYLAGRFAVLEQVYVKINDKSIQIVPFMVTETMKKAFVDQMKLERKEGVVFKKMDGRYVAGKELNISKSSAIKVKFYSEGSFIAESWNEKSSIALSAFKNGDRVHVGNVTVPEKYKKQIVIGGIVSVRYLYATDASVLYQSNLNPDDNGSVVRNDIPLSDCVIEQLKYEGKD